MEMPPAELPADFTPPRPIPEVMTLEKPLLSEAEDQAFRQDLLKYQRALRAGVVNGETKKLIEAGAKWRVYRMSLPEHRRELHKLRDDIVLRDVQFASKLDGAPQAGRELLLEQVTKRASELLDGNFYVRLNAVLLLGQLDLQEEDTRRGVRQIAYTPAAEVLLPVLTDPKQLTAIKIPTVKGLARIAEIGQPSLDLRLRIAQSIVAELQLDNNELWYRERLVESLGSVGILVDRTPRPFVIQTLASIVVDPKEHWLVRTAAAKAIGRLPLNASINLRLVGYSLVKLGHEMSDAYNKSPNEWYWNDCFFRLYLAFHHANKAEEDANLGLLRRTRNLTGNDTIQNAFNQVLPLIQHVVGSQARTPIAKQNVDAVAQLLTDNAPQDFKIAPTEDPILTDIKAVAEPAKEAASG